MTTTTLLPSIENYESIETDFAEDFSIPQNIQQNIDDVLLGSFQFFGKKLDPKLNKVIKNEEERKLDQLSAPKPPQPPQPPQPPKLGKFFKVNKRRARQNHIRRLK